MCCVPADSTQGFRGMLPDIRMVVTAIATTVLILVGFGLMASVRMTHQGLGGGSVVASSHPDPTLINRMTWRQVSEGVVSPAEETTDISAIAPEERDLAERVLASLPAPRYAAAGEEAADDRQIIALLAAEQAAAEQAAAEQAAAAGRRAAVASETTASITPALAQPKIIAPAVNASKKVSARQVVGKRKPSVRPRIAASAPTAWAAQARPSRASPVPGSAQADDKNLLEILFGFDQLH